MELLENMLLQFKDGRTIRVVYNNRLSSIVRVIDMEGNRWAYEMEKDSIFSLFELNEISKLTEDYFYRHVVEEDLSNAEKTRRDRAWEIVTYVYAQLENEEQMFMTKYRDQAMKRAVAVYQINYRTVKSYLIAYWKYGKIRNALLPSFHMCGARGQEKKGGERKRGRPSSISSQQGVNVDEKIKKYFRTGLNRYYYNDKQNTLKVSYELTIRDFFTEKEQDHNGNTISILKDTSKIPSYHQFLYWFRKFNDPKKEVSMRNGSRVYHQKYRGIIGNSTQDAGSGPATLWQTDSTPLDVHCVSINRNILVGKPLFHLVIDVYSRLIVGFSLSFESLNSYSGAMMALLNSMTPKKEFCKRYGIEIKDEWDVDCVPQRIFTDRGELNGKQIEGAIEGLGISVQNSPPYFPQAKGIVETMFNQIHSRIKPHIDGAVINGNRVRERGEKDFRLKANLTIDEVTAILIKCIVFYNNHHVIEGYPLTEEMIAEGVEKIPRKIWEFGLKHQKGQLRVLPEEVIRMHLLPTQAGSITAKGVKFKQLLYASEYSLKNNWFQRARINGSSKIKIWYDPRNLTHIYTANEENNGFHKFTLLDHLTKFKNKGIEEVDQIIKHERSIDSKGKERELKEKVKLFDDIEKIVTTGKQKTEEQKDNSISKTQKLKGIKENQRKERQHQRDLLTKENDNLLKQEEIARENIVDELDLFRSLQGVDENE
ncbi:Mu transposase C-terminal domain-containing protein [Cytobacillus sp. FJAT-53684]|uniref:Mu transposase C-terminal domain-containing protein n=1 Tax=Cytobacillus mangrovibacter TaxID=3299024 RepID=A0ABW6K2A0_9BACI